MKINTILPQDNKFLQIIGTIAKPPEKLYFIGQFPEKRYPTVAIVGSRKRILWHNHHDGNIRHDPRTRR